MLSWLRGIPGVDTLEEKGLKPVLHDSFFFHFRIYYRTANSQGQFGGDSAPGVLAQFIIMMHSVGKLFSKMHSFHYNALLENSLRS